MADTNENDYLEMANHCKQVVEQKDRIIDFYKNRLSDIDDELRCLAYLTSNMLYLGEYQLSKDKDTCKKNTDKTFFEIMRRDLQKISSYVDSTREMTDVDQEDEDLAILLVNM